MAQPPKPTVDNCHEFKDKRTPTDFNNLEMPPMPSNPAINASSCTGHGNRMASSKLSFNEYRTLVEQSPILIWRADLTMGCDYFNDRWLAFSGRTMEQESGNGWAEGVHPDDLQRCLKIYTESFARREIFEMEYRLRRVDGVFRWLFDRGVPYSGPTGEFAGFIGSCVDVTERVEAQAQVKAAQEAEVKMLQNLLPICAWCRKVREDSGYWQQLEGYVAAHFPMRFTHGICPECEGEHFPCPTQTGLVNDDIPPLQAHFRQLPRDQSSRTTYYG